jgi:hypothetical protein
MKTPQIELTEQTASKFQAAARELGISPEELLKISIEEKLTRLEDELRLRRAAEYVFTKNAELYKRLA